MASGQGADAEIGAAAAVAAPNPAILRKSTLRNIKIRHDLDSRCDCWRYFFGQAFYITQYAIHAKANQQSVILWLHMDIACLHHQGFN